MGGVARRATLIETERDKGAPVLLVDGGDLPPSESNENPWPWEKATYLWDCMAELGYDAVTPGDDDLIEGLDSLRVLYARHPEIHVVSANLKDKEGDLLFPEYVVLDKGGIKVGITGVTNPLYYRSNLNRGEQKRDDFEFDEPAEALRRVIPEMQDQCDVVMGLLHVSAGDAKRLVDEVQGLDVVLVGHNPGYMFNPDRINETLMIRPGTLGKYLAVLNLTLDDATKKIVDYNGHSIKMNEAVPMDPQMEAQVTAFMDNYEHRRDELQKKKAAEAAVLQGTEKYVGAEMCARCHVEEYTAWSQTPHAQAYEALVEAQQQNVDECLECHVVGMGEPSGYEVTWPVDSKGKRLDPVDTPALRGVQCESCHGMGTFHGTQAMIKDPGEDTCRNCHVGEFGEGFDYQKSLANGMVH